MEWDNKGTGKRIQERRKEKHMTQEQLAEAAGISTAFVGHIERGTRIPSVCTLYSICSVLEIQMEYAITGKNEKT